MKYRKKPVIIEAILFDGKNCFEIMHFMNRSQDIFDGELNQTDIPAIHTLEGVMVPTSGDWIIKGVKGEFYPVKDEIFQLTYEKVEES